MKYLVVAVLLISLLCSSCITTVDQQEPNRIVLFVIDGCRPDYLESAIIPNIRSLMTNGTTYSDAWVGGLRNTSAASHAMLGTGSFPKNNGVIDLFQKDALTGKFGFYNTWEEVVSGNFNRRMERMSITSLSKVYQDKYPNSMSISISSSRYFAAASMGQGANLILFNDTFYNFIPNKEYQVFGVLGHELPFSLSIKGNDEDDWVTNLSLKMIEEYSPNLLMINFPLTDYVGHMTNINNSDLKIRETIANVDNQIGRIIEEYKRRGYYDNTIFVLVSDHGMTPSLHWISQQRLNDIAKGDNSMITPSSECYIANYDESKYNIQGAVNIISNGKSEIVAKDIWDAHIVGIKNVYYKTEDNNYLSASEKISKSLDDCYKYLLSSYASDFSPDIVVITRENWRPDSYKFFPQPIEGNHETISWNTQHIVLILSGPNIKKGVTLSSPARIIDICPTLMELCGIEFNDIKDGIILADCMQNAEKISIDKQNEFNQRLKFLSSSLKEESYRDILDNVELFGSKER